MTRQSLRDLAMRIGKNSLIVGLPVFLAGMWLGSPAITMAGCAALSMAIYSMAFAQVGAVL